VPIDVALQIVIRILEALHYAHTLTRADGTSTQVVHRDISPSNILLDAEGNVRLLDFGIARIANAANVYQTQETTFKGKLGYAHPSLIARGEPSAQTDVYSAAVVLFQLLIGQNPFRGANPAETLQKVIRGPLPRLRASLPTAPESLELVLLRAMSRNLSEGFASAAELAEELRAIRVGTETSVNAEMSRTFRADFHGDMAVLLDLEPLEQRDAAWRSMAHAHAPGALKSTPPRAPDSEEPTRIRRTNSDEPTRAAPSIPPEKSVTGRTSLPSLARRNPWPWVGVSVALTLGIAWTVTTAMHEPSDLRPLNDPLPASLTPVAIALPEPTRAPEPPASVKTVATVNTAEPVIKAPIRPDLGLLTRRFTEQSTDIQRCFKEHPQATASATLQLSLSVSQSGLVTAANLIPVALEKSAFGQCALAIARTARFDAMTDAVTFRVPLTRAAD
jgi:serine/threonine-protein kinase